MQKYSIALLALATALAISPAAKADTYYSFTYSGGGETASGWLTVSPTVVGTNNGAPGYNIDGGEAIIDGNVLSLVTNSNPGIPFIPSPGTYEADDVLYPTAGTSFYLDNSGVIFDGSGNVSQLNIWGNADGYTDSLYDNTLSGGNYTVQDTTGTFSLGAPVLTPEPSSLFLLGTGLFGLAFVAFRKAKSTGTFQTL